MTVLRFPDEWERLATGTLVDDSPISFWKTAETHSSMSDDNPLRRWSASIWAIDHSRAEQPRLEIASTRALELPLGAGDWSALVDAADEEGEIPLMGALRTVRDDLYLLDELASSVAPSKFIFITEVSAREEIRGHGWGATAVATLLQLTDREDALVIGELPGAGDPAHGAAVQMVATFEAQQVGSSNLYWQHTSLRTLDDAVRRLAAGPYDFL